MADQLNVLVICGSLRKGSYNAALTRALPALVPPEMKLIAAPSFATLPLYNADTQEASGFPGPANDLAVAIRSADGVLFVTPEYNWSMPGGLKNAIDWVSRIKDQPFEGKPVAIQSCSQGPLGGADRVGKRVDWRGETGGVLDVGVVERKALDRRRGDHLDLGRRQFR